jgi:CRISPR/Cas system-associated protein Csm6
MTVSLTGIAVSWFSINKLLRLCYDLIVDQKGKSLAARLNSLIERDSRPNEEVVKVMASVAGISTNTVNQILRAEILCPPRKRLVGFASALGVSVNSILSAARKDGCTY